MYFKSLSICKTLFEGELKIENIINYLLEPFLDDPNLGYSNELVIILEKLKSYKIKNQLENLCFKPSFNSTENSCAASAG
jgi:hypothetical protein